MCVRASTFLKWGRNRVGQKRGFCENPTFTEKFGTPVEFEGPGFADSVPVDNNNPKTHVFTRTRKRQIWA